MRASHISAAAAFLLATTTAWSMDNSDLIKLKKAAFADETIIHTMDQEPANYDTSASALIDLKEAGLSEAVINHALAKQASAPRTEVPAARPVITETSAPSVAPASPVVAAVPSAAAAPAASPTPTAAPTAPPAAPVASTADAPEAAPAAPAQEAAPVTSAPPPSASDTPPSTPAVASAPPAETVAVPTPAQPELFNIDSPSIAPPFEDIVPDRDYFTRFSFHQEHQTYLTTNYARGTLVPINTPVHVVAISHRKIALKRLDTGESLYIENVEKYSRKNIAQIASIVLSSVKTPVERLAPPLVTAIESGEMRKGMTKEQVILARGYPPAHETPSTDSDRWKFWSSRFIKQTIIFSNGRLTAGRDIP